MQGNRILSSPLGNKGPIEISHELGSILTLGTLLSEAKTIETQRDIKEVTSADLD